MVSRMRITTWNVNGLRAALGKRLPAHLDVLRPDVLLLQEVRARPEQLPGAWAQPDGWTSSWLPADRPGYAGVALWTRSAHDVIGVGPSAHEGRVLHARTDGLHAVSCYLPSGSSGPEAQARKDQFLSDLSVWLAPLAAAHEPVVLGGDLNVAPTDADIHDPRGNRSNSGFLPHERAWFATLLASGWTDLVRAALPDRQGPYTWWSNRGRARELDRGWRIDHLLGNRAAADALIGASVHREGGLDTSDHAPVSVDLDLPAPSRAARPARS
jgi:exodeoxyribonuclease-3